MFKKKISLLAAISTVTTLSPIVISCGISLDYLTNRLIDSDTFRSVFRLPVESWSTGTTMAADDNKVLADLIGTLVATDKYNRSYGDLAYQADKKSPTVGVANGDSSEWTYTIAPDAKWFDYQGNFIRPVKASDMRNTAKFVLYPKNISQVGSLWRNFIAGAEEIWDYFQNNKATDYINDPIWDNLGVYADDSTNKVTFKLAKSAPYFDTLMTYLAFAPMPEEALKKSYTYGANYRNILYSGAYLVKEYNPSLRILLQKNNNYRFASQTYIKNLDYTYLGSSDVARERILFESGDINDFVVNPADTSGWNKYVGLNPATPKFQVASSTINPDPVTYTLFLNFANSDVLDLNSSVSQAAIKSSKALQYHKVRKYLATHLNRSLFVRAYSEALDASSTSSFLRNVYTARNFVTDTTVNPRVDYTSYIEQKYGDTFLDGDYQKAKTLLSDGSDALYKNNDLLKDDPDILTEIRNWLQQNLGQDKITLKILMNGSSNLTSNIFLLDMIDTFNQEQNIISIVPDISTDKVDYIVRSNKGNWDLRVGGWGPDYSDPATYLYTYIFEGDLSVYNGFSRLFSNLELNNGVAPDFENANLNNEYWQKLQTSASKDFYNENKDFNNLVIASDQITNPSQLTERYQGFADAEFQAIYEKYLIMPLYVPNGSYQVKISYVTPHTQITIGYGSSKYKHWGMEMNRYLLTAEERRIIEARYQEQMAIIEKDPGALREDY